jgi:hypothetical protein
VAVVAVSWDWIRFYRVFKVLYQQRWGLLFERISELRMEHVAASSMCVVVFVSRIQMNTQIIVKKKSYMYMIAVGKQLESLCEFALFVNPWPSQSDGRVTYRAIYNSYVRRHVRESSIHLWLFCFFLGNTTVEQAMNRILI